MKNPTMLAPAATVLGTLASIPLALLHITFILIIEGCLFAITFFGGLVSGNIIVHNMYAFTGKAEVITGPVRAFKEVLWGGVIMMSIVFIAVIPFEKRVLRPLRNALYKRVGVGPDLILLTVNAYVMGSCLAEASVLFEVRYCKKDFDLHWLNGPIRAFIYYIEEYKGEFLYGSHSSDGLEAVIMFPLVVAFSVPIYSFMRCYMTEKSSRFSVMGFLDNVIPKPCCCEVEEEDEYKIDWFAQIYSLFLEFGQVVCLYIPTTALVQVAFVLAGDYRPGFLFVGFGIFGFIYALSLVLMEVNFPKSFKRGQNGVEIRILFILAVLTFFVTKNFLVYFEEPTDEPCQNGQMEMRSLVARSFACYFTVSMYAGSKIIFLCATFHNNEKKNAVKVVQKLMMLKSQRKNVNKKQNLPTFVLARHYPRRNFQCRTCTLKNLYTLPKISGRVFDKTVSHTKMIPAVQHQQEKSSQC